MLKSENALSCLAEPGVMEFDYLHYKSGNWHKSFLIGQGQNPQGMGSNVSLTGAWGGGRDHWAGATKLYFHLAVQLWKMMLKLTKKANLGQVDQESDKWTHRLI